MSFFSQLKLLLWKNYTLRKRNKFRCLMEIAWPVCLFLLMALVRMKGFQSTIHQCHFEEKELPSSGPLVFYRSMICSLNNTCHKYPPHNTYLQHPLWWNAVKEILVMNSDPTSSASNSFSSIISNITQLSQALSLMNVTGSDLNNSSQTLIKLMSDINGEVDKIDKIISTIETLQNISSSNYDNAQLSDVVKDTPWINEMLSFAHDFICGNETKISLDMFLSNEKSSYQQYMGTMTSKHEPPDINPNQSEECREIFIKVESSPFPGPTWSIIKPYVRGKIVYSPDTPLVRRLISKIKTSLSPPNMHIMEFQNELLQIYPNLSSLHFNQNMSFQKLSHHIIHENDTHTILNGTSLKYLNDTLNKIHSTFIRLNDTIYVIKNKNWNNINLTTLIQCYSQSGRFEGYATEEEATERSMKLCDNNILLAQINFIDSMNETFNPIITYKIRMNTNRLPTDASFIASGGGPRFRPFTDLKLITLGFIYLQDAVERAILTEVTGREDLPTICLNQMPHPCFIHDWFMQSVLNMFPMFMILSWVYTSSMIVKNIVFEKEQRLKETMRVLGLTNSLLWLGWFVDSFVFLTFACALLSIVLVYGGILAHADVTLIFVYLMIFSVATINTSFLISVFFSKANIAASSGGLIFFTLYLPFAFLEYWPSYFMYTTKILMCLITNVAFAVGSKHLAMLELEGIGARWSNIAEPKEAVNLLIIILVLLLDSAIYFLVAWYIENVAPGDFGVPKKWYFLGTKEYWFGGKEIPIKGEKDSDPSNDVVEAEPLHLPRGVAIRNLTKVYGNGKVAVANLSVNFYESQITAFLGKNGAGKTTTLSVLTGLLPPTRGTAYIYGLDIRTDMSSVRKSLGICPQHNILFVKLTVEEQLWFYARLRGHTPGDAQLEVRQALADLGLESKRNTPTSQLSGGMQRKLCIAIAFIGKSKTIILDEPTAGVDPFSRIAIWNLLLKYKFGRTIIMTTHSMTEAEVLSDRIAIFSSGRILCSGSISFLRERFGRGYNLTVDRGISSQESGVRSTGALTNVIKTRMRDVQLIEEYGTEVKYTLPKLSENIDDYSKLFSYLNENKEFLGIRSFGLSDTSLEEIFVKLVDEADSGTYNVEPPMDKNDFPECEKNVWRLGMQRFRALTIKRFHHYKRNKMLVFCGTLFPAFFIALTLSITNSVPKLYQPEAKVVDISNCEGCVLFFGFNRTSPTIDGYIAETRKLNGFSALCDVNSSFIERKKFCNLNDEISMLNVSKVNYTRDCSCEIGKLHCSDPVLYDELPYINMSSRNTLINVTGLEVSEWVLDSWEGFEEWRFFCFSLYSSLFI